MKTGSRGPLRIRISRIQSQSQNKDGQGQRIPNNCKEKEALGLQMQNPYLIKGHGLLKVKKRDRWGTPSYGPQKKRIKKKESY
jgi:hypothetical protein